MSALIGHMGPRHVRRRRCAPPGHRAPSRASWRPAAADVFAGWRLDGRFRRHRSLGVRPLTGRVAIRRPTTPRSASATMSASSAAAHLAVLSGPTCLLRDCEPQDLITMSAGSSPLAVPESTRCCIECRTEAKSGARRIPAPRARRRPQATNRGWRPNRAVRWSTTGHRHAMP